jgi:nucleotide-binding universal stress UspA family protein
MSVLVAYDGMEHTKKALNYSIRYSMAFGEKLYIFSSVVSKDKLDHDDEVARVNAFLDEAVAVAVEAGADAVAVLESGNPAKSILDAAARFDASAVVVGRSDKTFFDRALLGSVSDAVIRSGKCIVIVVQ